LQTESYDSDDEWNYEEEMQELNRINKSANSSWETLSDAIDFLLE